MRGAVHDLTLQRIVPQDPDSSGRNAEAKPPLIPFRGRISIASARERVDAASYAEDVSAIALAPTDLRVTDADRIVAEGIHPLLDGTYEIGAIVHGVKLLKILLRRSAV